MSDLKEKIINELLHCPIRDDGIAAAADRILALLTPAAPSEAADVIAARLRAAFASNKDFCDGVATRIIADLTAAGYRIVPSAPPPADTVRVRIAVGMNMQFGCVAEAVNDKIESFVLARVQQLAALEGNSPASASIIVAHLPKPAAPAEIAGRVE